MTAYTFSLLAPRGARLAEDLAGLRALPVTPRPVGGRFPWLRAMERQVGLLELLLLRDQRLELFEPIPQLAPLIGQGLRHANLHHLEKQWPRDKHAP